VCYLVLRCMAFIKINKYKTAFYVIPSIIYIKDKDISVITFNMIFFIIIIMYQSWYIT